METCRPPEERKEEKKMKLINREDTLFVVIDFQEKLMPVMHGKEILENKVCRLAEGMKKLGIPNIVTQQYTKGIGETIPPIAEAVGRFTPIDKTSFSCMGNEEFVAKLEEADRDTIVICGIEAHICLQQTVLELLAKGYKVYVPSDCTSSRSEHDKLWSLDRMSGAGAVVTTYEAILYELLRSAEAEEFKAISKIVK